MQPSKPCTPLTLDEPLTMPLHPKEQALLSYLRRLKHGTLYRLLIQDGLPVLVEEVSHTIKF
jgi:hypothetical protein